MQIIEKFKNNKLVNILFIIILILQITAILYAASKREYFHMDELYSFGLMQYRSAFIFENEDFLNNWHSSEYFKDYLRISDENKWDFSAVYKNQIQDVHPPFWYLLLRIAYSFCIGKTSVWPGIILNIILYSITSTILFLIGNKIFKNKYCSLLLCMLNGFSLASMQITLFIRMYQLFILNVVLIVYWHLIKKDVQQLDIKKDLLPLYFMVIIGFLTHYYYVIFAIVLFIMYLIKYIKEKSYQNMKKYILTLSASAVTAICIFPYCIKHIFFSYRGVGIAERIKNLELMEVLLIKNVDIVNKNYFYKYMYILILVIIFLLIILLIIKRINKNKNKLQGNKDIIYVSVPMVIYFIIESCLSPYFDFRYVVPITPLIFCSLLYLLWYILRNMISEKATLTILSTIIIAFSSLVIPKLPDTLYTQNSLKGVSEYIKSYLQNQKILYIYEELSAQYNRMMTLYAAAFTVAEETYVLPDTEVTTENIKNVLANVNLSDGIFLILDDKNKDEFLQQIVDTDLFEQINIIFWFNGYCICLLS